ncbi:MAG: hypothetical protein ACLP59_26790 [Bryobacteraceae bacterium]
MQLTETLRQLRFPPEFRIAAPTDDGDSEELLKHIAKLLEGIAATPPQPPDEPDAEHQRTKFLADLATGIWRLRNKMVDPATGRPLEEMRRAYRPFESVWDLLASARVQVLDHTGEDFHPGKTLKALAFEPHPGFRKQKVLETIKPTVYVGEEFAQMGEVIVGTPEEGNYR